jgi:hypothetical protein
MARPQSKAYPGFPADLEGPLAKADRAETHVNDFQARVRSAVNSWLSTDPKPYRSVKEQDAEGRERGYYVFDNIFEVSVDLTAILGDIFHNLNSALDQLVCALAERNGLDPCTHYFPVRQTAEKFDAAVKEIRGLDATTREGLKQLKAFHGGDAYLWPIRRLNNIDKHRTVMTIAIGGGAVTSIAGVVFPGKTTVLKPGEKVSFETLFPFTFHPYVHTRITIDVALYEPDIWAEPQLLGWFLNGAVGRVRSIIGTFK